MQTRKAFTFQPNQSASLALSNKNFLSMCIRKNETILPPWYLNELCEFSYRSGQESWWCWTKILESSMHSAHTTTHNTDAIHETSGSQDLKEIQYSDSGPRESRDAATACVGRSLLAACPHGRTDRGRIKASIPTRHSLLDVAPRSIKMLLWTHFSHKTCLQASTSSNPGQTQMHGTKTKLKVCWFPPLQMS